MTGSAHCGALAKFFGQMKGVFMGDRKRRKKNKLRGQRTMGAGGTKNRRGAGCRGGRGNAGSNKQNWTYISKFCPGYFGRTGFKRPDKMLYDDITINVCDIENNLKSMVADGKAVEKSGKYVIDLTAMGFDKLLGSGKVKHALEIKVAKSSASAAEKIKKAGGKVEMPAESA